MRSKSNLQPHKTGTLQYTRTRMQLFGVTEEDHQYALTLAEAVASFTSDAHNAALVLLIGGIAAIENAEDRQMLAEVLIKRFYSYTASAHEGLQAFILKWESKGMIEKEI
ncbi:MAG: hypothetical protein WKF84_28780 [Pyrinomonadaceae bacterium]